MLGSVSAKSELTVPQDSGDVLLEAQLTGEKGFYDCPVKLSIYGPTDPAERARVEASLKKDKLVKATELKKTKQEAESRRALMGLTSGSSSHGLPSGIVIETEPELTLESILKTSEAVEFRSGGDAIKTLAIDENQLAKMPMADQPGRLKAQLLPYQLQVSYPEACFIVLITDME